MEIKSNSFKAIKTYSLKALAIRVLQEDKSLMYISDVRSSLIITLQPHRWASETALVISWCLLGVKTSNRGVRRGTGFLSMLFLRKKKKEARPQQHTSLQDFL